MPKIERIFASRCPSGLHRLASTGELTSAAQLAAEHRYLVVRVDLPQVGGKAGFLDALAQGFRFPGHFGENWDAFEDGLTDLEWLKAPGYLLILSHVASFAESYAEEWQTAEAILRDACRHWKKAGVPFLVLLK